MGAWIEIYFLAYLLLFYSSLLSWERGLKSIFTAVNYTAATVAPLVGAWIEIVKNTSAQAISVAKSLLSWERGLKSQDDEIEV